MFSKLAEHLRRLVTQPIDELRGIQYSIRYLIDLLTYCAKELAADRAEEMAAALTYRTIFSLVPLFVLGLVVFRMFGDFQDVQTGLQEEVYEFFGVPEVTYTEDLGEVEEDLGEAEEELVEVKVPELDEQIEQERVEQLREEAGIPEGERERIERQEQERQLRASLKKVLTELMARVANTNFTNLRVAGVLLFIYAAMALALSVEYDFNIIFDSPKGRPWHLRVAIYWSIITLGGALLAMSLYLTAEMVTWFSQFGLSSPGTLWLLNRALALLASWLLLFLLYLLMPNTSVHVQPALGGSFVAALLWEIGKVGFQTYVTVAVPYSTYGSLGLVPVFLFWIYISWLIVLFGLELAFTLQVMHGKVPTKEEKPAPRLPGDPDWLIPMLAQIGREFLEGRTLGRQDLSERLNLPTRIISEYGGELEKAGMIHLVQPAGASDVGYALARPPERIRIRDVLELGRQLSRDHQRERQSDWEYVDQLFQAKFNAADGVTLSHLIENGQLLEQSHLIGEQKK